MEIIPLKYGKSFLPGNMVFKNGNFEDKYPIDFIVYLVKTKDKMILIDAGCETMPGFAMKDFIGSVNALKNHGLSTNDVTDVIITHSHHDHIECVKYFKNSVIHIQRDELKLGRGYLTSDLKINSFDEEYTVCDNIRILKIGGHSVGSCIVEICDNIIVVGDECYIRECIDRNIPTGASVNPEKSKDFIEKYGSSKYRLLFSHCE